MTLKSQHRLYSAHQEKHKRTQLIEQNQHLLLWIFIGTLIKVVFSLVAYSEQKKAELDVSKNGQRKLSGFVHKRTY